MVKTEPEKVTYMEAEAQQKTPDFTGVLNSRRALVFGSDMSLGNPVVKLVPPNET